MRQNSATPRCTVQEAAECGLAGPSPLPAFYRWVVQQQAAGRLQFSVKGQAETLDWEQDAAEAAAQAPAGAPDSAPAPAAGPAPAAALAAAEVDAECEPAMQGASASQRR